MATATATRRAARGAGPTPGVELTVTRSALLEALGWCVAAIPTRSPSPALECALLEVSENGATLRATNFAVLVKTTLPADVGALSAGRFLLPARRLLEIATKLPSSAPVKLSLGTRAIITAGASRFELPVLDASEFPTGVPFDAHPNVTPVAEVSGPALAAALKGLAPFASTAESRPILNGILLECERTEVTAVATDGHKLGRLPLEGTAPTPAQLIIPRTAAALLAKLLLTTDRVALEEHGNWLRIATETTTVGTLLIEGPYPAYQQLLTRPRTRYATIGAAEFRAALDRVGVIASHDARSRLSTSWTAAQVTLAATSPDAGNATDTVACDVGGDAPPSFEIDFDPSLMDAALALVGAERIRIEFGGSEQAMWLAAEDQAGAAGALVMPLRRL